MADPTDRPLRGEIPSVLPSGRRLLVSATERGEELRVLSARGDLEMSIELTPQGPVVRLRGASLEIDSSESVAVRCKSFHLRTESELEIQAGGDVRMGSDREIRVRSAGQTFLDGDYVNINCLERTGYHDESSAAAEGGAIGDPVDDATAAGETRASEASGP